MKAFTPPEVVDNLILRVENHEENPHPEMEAAGVQCPGMWIKDYDVFSIGSQEALIACLRDAARIASEVPSGKKTIFMEPVADVVLRLPQPLLQAIAEAGCTLELFCGAE